MINKLNIEFDVISIFDSTYSQEARALLIKLLGKVISRKEIADRQLLLKTFVNNWQTLSSFFYSNYDMKEVMEFTKKQRKNRSSENLLSLFPSLKRDNIVLRSRCIQTISFLYDLHDFYSKRIAAILFPESLQGKIENINRFISVLNVDNYYNAIKNGALGIRESITFSKKIAELEPDFVDEFWENLFEFEMYWSVARGIVNNSFSFPDVDNEAFSISGFYHPLVKNVVRNNLSIDKNIVLLTGPNMSGKSTILKALSLCVYFAHIGIAVPAESCRIPYFERFLFSINVNDDIKNGYSGFMNEIVGLKQILLDLTSNHRCFALFDELFNGTNIDDAQELMRITINGLYNFKHSFFIISTHLYQLQTMGLNDNFDAYQLEAMIENGNPVHTFKLQNGWSNLKFGRLIFEKEGLTKLLSK